MDTHAQHQKFIGKQFTQQAVPFSPALRIKDEAALKLIVTSTRPKSEDTVLDLACSSGLLVCAFAEVVRYAVGISSSLELLDRARLLQRQKGLTNVSWLLDDSLTLPYRSGSFSIVIARHAFHHALDPQAVLLEMVRVCSPGGRIAVIDVVASPDGEKAIAFNQMEKLRDPSHVKTLQLSELETLLKTVELLNLRTTFYRKEIEVECLIERSLSHQEDADRIRQLFIEELECDRMGISTYRRGNQIFCAYAVAVLVAEKPFS